MTARRPESVATRASSPLILEDEDAGNWGGRAVQVILDEGFIAFKITVIDVLAVDEALTKLATFYGRQSDIMELHFFSGLRSEENVLQLGISLRTVKRDWIVERARLRGELSSTR